MANGRAAWLMLCAVAASCGYPELPSPSCAGLAASCGAGENRSCCEAAMVPGGQFYRGDDQAADALHKDMDHPAMVSAFVLDRYEVTVGRFRQFVAEGKGTQQGSPASGAGAHPASRDSGWDSAWDGKLAADTAALIAAVQCDAKYSTWTDSAGSGDNKPINCVTWYEAMAFCIWDGGYLPTEAEWSFAASGGSEQRAYPWSVPASSTTIDCSYANYQLTASPATYCTNGSIGGTRPAGREPLGDGKWGHSDLAGNVFEWMLDWYTAYPVPCMDCAALATPDPAQRVLRGGGFFNEDVSILRSNYRLSHGPSVRSTTYGVRCARTP